MKLRGIGRGILFFLFSFLICFFLFYFLIPKSDSKVSLKELKTKKISDFHYVAIGDSLTQGVGDSTEQGGFVPLLSLDVGNKYNVHVISHNFGVSGNTSQQILDRMNSQTKITNQLKKAKLMTLTVGGNDVMAVIRKNLSHLSVSSFEKPSKNYQKRLSQILTLARKDNPDLPIYVLGIYNPFYLNFPEMTQMQEVVDNWNEATKETTSNFKKVYFVPINDLLYKGIDGKEGVVQSSGSKTQVINDALFTGDHFHPNNTGYHIMSDAVMEKIIETRK